MQAARVIAAFSNSAIQRFGVNIPSFILRRHYLRRQLAILSRVPAGYTVSLPSPAHIFAPRCSLENRRLDAPSTFAAAQMTDDVPTPLAPPGLSRTFYKRELPCPPAVAFSSSEGQEIFSNALVAGMLQGFFKLIANFSTQAEPAYCGLASVAMVLNTLAIDPRRAWKGPWRYFHEQMLDCCLPLEKVRQEGITLSQAACLARCNGAAVDVYTHGTASLEEFREMIKNACSSGESHLVVSYTRKAFLQTGDGHFSPVGGYSPDRDMVLILDTARFKYPPHWVRLEELFDAMAALDPTTGKPRGFMRLRPQPLLESVLFTLDLRDPLWEAAFQYTTAAGGMTEVTAAAAAAPGANLESIVAAVGASAPFNAVSKFIAVRMAGNSCTNGVCTQMDAIGTFLYELRGMPLYQTIANASLHASAEDSIEVEHNIDEIAELKQQPAVAGPLVAERLTMLLLLAPEQTWEGVQSETLRQELSALLDMKAYKVVGHEVQYLKEQYKELPTMKKALETVAPVSCSDGECLKAGNYPVCEDGEGKKALL